MVRTHRVGIVLAGCGTDERRLRRLAARLGVSECVQSLGYVGDAQLPGQRGPATLGSHRLQFGNLLRRFALPLTIQSWSLTSLQPRLFKTGGASSGMRDTSSSSLPKAT